MNGLNVRILIKNDDYMIVTDEFAELLDLVAIDYDIDSYGRLMIAEEDYDEVISMLDDEGIDYEVI